MDAKQFLEALEEIEKVRGISKDATLNALKEAIEKGFKKQLGGDDAYVKVEIDAEKGTINMAQLKAVVDEVEDDFLEISVKEANEKGGSYKAGDFFEIPASTAEMQKNIALAVKNYLKQKLSEEEKKVLYDIYKDKIGEMITGRVEKFDDNGATVSLGRTTAFLTKKELIKGEAFKSGDAIKLYVDSVDTGKGSTARVIVTRANEGFLKRLFEEEIHEIYDGTITIKGIAREAGERSKVAVYSQNPDVDPAGSCIGPNGSRIQKVVSQLGNGQNKEKIDIIAWSENVGLFIMESMKPSKCLGIILDEAEKKATVIVPNEGLSLAIGRRAVNVRLANRLTGYDIKVLEQDMALQMGLEYTSFEELEAKELEARKIRSAQKIAKASETLGAVPNGYVAPSQRHYADTISAEEKEALEEAIDREETQRMSRGVKSFETIATNKEEVSEVSNETAPVEEVTTTTTVEETVEVKEPAKEEVKVENVAVNTTKTLEDLEKELEQEKKAKADYANRKKNWKKKDKKEEDEDSTSVVTKEPKERMAIYTEEELKEMENEELDSENFEEENDYSDYDDDSLYDEK